jgi:pilus assembly protein Flp/PilA
MVQEKQVPQPGKERTVKALIRLWKAEEGQDLVEYALLIVLISMAALVAMRGLARAISDVFSSAATNLSASTS